MSTQFEELSIALNSAAANATIASRPSDSMELTLADAYQVQRAGIARRLDAGEIPTGIKLGFTSRAKARQMGVDEVILGQLTNITAVPNGGTTPRSRFIHPRVEPEVAFLLARPLGEIDGDPTIDDVAAIAPALEIIDSRFEAFRFSLTDVVADNTSAAGYVIGVWQSPNGVNLRNRGVILRLDGRVADSGTTAAILGNPLSALGQAARLCGRYGISTKAGDVLLAGAATEAASLQGVTSAAAEVSGLGDVAFGLTG
jgi:2-oxo-3-hexenedioate decarboxylase